MFRTTYPNKVFDYMAAGRPTLLAIDGVIRQVMEAAEGGLFVPPGDDAALAEAALQCSEDPGRVEAMGRRGLLLPKVATRLGWGCAEFIRNVCQKAGLPADIWPSNGTLYKFNTIEFHD